MFRDLLRLFFPNLCIACNAALQTQEKHLCTTCLLNLPQTGFHKDQDNPLTKTFWGRLQLEHALAFLYFKKGNAVQHILHEIKYKNNRDLAIFMGGYYGQLLKADAMRFDAVAAIPLHQSKLRKRGYNQSALFAAGLAKSLGCDDYSPLVIRTKATETQTRKSRFERWENVAELFTVTDPQPFQNKHILLVDDVITTGATIEACGAELLQIKGIQLSIAGIAFTQQT